MSKYIFFLLFFFITLLTFSQNVTSIKVENSSFVITIKFDELKYIDNIFDGITIRDYFEYTDESKPNSFKLPSHRIILAIPPNIKPIVKIINTKQITHNKTIPSINNIKKITNEKENLNEIISEANNSYPKTVIEETDTFWLRDFFCLSIPLNSCVFNLEDNSINEIKQIELSIDFKKPLHILNDSPIKIKTSFDKLLNKLFINSQIAEQFRSTPNYSINDENNDDWIEYGAEYAKFSVNSDGIYRITYDDFLQNNIDPSIINPKKLKIFKNGIEVPIYFSDEKSSTFNIDNYIEFYGERNYSSESYLQINGLDQPYNEFIDRYSKNSIYWLNWSGADGKRIKIEDNFTSGLLDTLKYYLNRDHYEENNYLDYIEGNIVNEQNPKWQSTETWIWGTQPPSTSSKTFIINDIEPNTNVNIDYKIFGFASNINEKSHKVALQLNNDFTLYDSTVLNRFEQKILHLNANSNLLNDGVNSIKLVSFETDSYPNTVAIDWFDVKYSRKLKIQGDFLKIMFPANLIEKEYIFEIENNTDDNFIVYKINDNKKIINYFLNNSKLLITDTLKSGDEYFVHKESQIYRPKFLYKKIFKNILSKEAEYILISNKSLLETSYTYADFVSNNYSISTLVVDVDDIYDQFNYGLFSPEPIRDFLKSAYNTWTNKSPSYLFLVGDANYDFHNNLNLEPYTENLVPSFGHPVSDNWFVIWDSLSVVPQMIVGRLAVSNNDEFNHFFEKHKKYLNEEFDQWNKSYLLLSGGLDEYSRTFTKNVNKIILDNVVKPPPVGGLYSFLYSTTDPPTNFGLYEQSYIDSAFATGGVAISYIGHSGTRIWDNGIEDVTQLYNDSDKSPFITDFGCSTGKFAEPDIISFSEAFTNKLEGQAIGYIGNSSLGFTSTTSIFPKIFYTVLLTENNSIGEAYLLAKTKFLNSYGNSGANGIFVYTNTLFTDPIIKLKIPLKPNLVVTAQDITFPEFMDDNLDSISVNIKFKNLGLVDTSEFQIVISDLLNGELKFTKTIKRYLPNNNDKIDLSIPIKGLSGKHTLLVNLDANNKINEIIESDNQINIEFDVLTSSIRLLTISDIENRFNDQLRFLNSVQTSGTDSFVVEIDVSQYFENPISLVQSFDTLTSDLVYRGESGKRYYMRSKLLNSDYYFKTVSFFKSNDTSSYYYLSDSTSFEKLKRKRMIIKNNSIKLDDKKIQLSLGSDGFNGGGVAKVQLDGVDYANNPRGCGHHIIVFDSKNYEYLESQWFNMWADDGFVNYINFLDTLSSNKYIAIALSNFCGGAGVNQALIDKLHEFGSTQIENIKYNTSWIFFGKKGNLLGTSLEKFSDSGAVYADTSFITKNKNGWFETEIFSKGIKTGKIKFSGHFSDNSITIQPIIFNHDIDTLESMQVVDSIVSLENLNYLTNYNKKFRVNIIKDDNITKQEINDFEIDIVLSPELAINYQVVSLQKDTLQQGEDVNLSFYVYNVGESTADSFMVQVDVIKPDNSKEKIFEQLVDSLGAEERKKFNISYNTTNFNGERTFAITIDSGDKILELYEDNNFYNIPFYVLGDTTKPSMTLTIDGNDIFDGEYISSTPKIKVELSDPSLIPITDTSSISIYLNNNYINYFGNEDILQVNFSATNPKVTVDYSPTLEDGEYTLRVFGKDASGNVSDSSGITKTFNIINEAKLLNVYNYPNPFSIDTYFTFKLTQIPDEIRIRIFTIAGRLIKEIELSSDQLNFDLNKIYWNGKDDDGDFLGNGVYLYKVIMDVGGKKYDVTQKMAVVR